MEKGRGASVMDHFQDLEDPRIERSKRHGLLDILTIAICAVICGADSWVYVEMFGKSKEEWFRSFLDLPNGIPSHDTFGDVFSRLDPDRFQECFMEWSQAVADLLPGEVVAIDGKTVRRSHDKRAGKQAIHLVSAWAAANTLTLGQVKTDQKSNEITAIPRLLELLELNGCIVTIDDVAHLRPSDEAEGFFVVLGHQRPGLLGIPEHRWRLARTAFRGESGGPPGHGHGHHGATEILHKQSRCLSGAAAGGGTRPLEYREFAALEPGRNIPGGPEPGAQRPQLPDLATLRQISHTC